MAMRMSGKILAEIAIIEEVINHMKSKHSIWFETKLASGNDYIKVIVYDTGQSDKYDIDNIKNELALRYKRLTDCSDWMYITPNDFVKNVLTDLGINNILFAMEITQEYYEELSNIFTDAYFENIKIV